MASGSKDSGRTKPHTRSAGPVYDIDIAFQENKIYYPTRQLPTLGGVIGMLRYHTSPRKLCPYPMIIQPYTRAVPFYIKSTPEHTMLDYT